MAYNMHGSEVWRQLHAARERWEHVCEQCAKAENTFSVVIIGEQNSGKSTLCNALMQDWQNATFPVSDIRETTTAREVEDVALGMIVVDTPGFGTYWKDDENAAKEQLLRTNLLIFVHSLSTGELNGKERDMLAHVRGTLPDVRERIFVVCSKLGDNAEEGDEVRNKVAAQTEEILGQGIQIESLDSKDYQEGMAAGDAGLVEYSRFRTLLQWLDAHRHMPSLSQKILDMAAQEYERALNVARETFDHELNGLRLTRSLYEVTLHSCWNGSRSGIQRSWDKCARNSK